MEPITVNHKLVEDYTPRWKSMEAVVLIVLITEPINSNYLPSDSIIFLLYVPLPPLGSLVANLEKPVLNTAKQSSFVHYDYIV